MTFIGYKQADTHPDKQRPKYTYRDIFCLSVCLSFCLYTITLKKAKPIGPKFCVGPTFPYFLMIFVIKILTEFYSDTTTCLFFFKKTLSLTICGYLLCSFWFYGFFLNLKVSLSIFKQFILQVLLGNRCSIKENIFRIHLICFSVKKVKLVCPILPARTILGLSIEKLFNNPDKKNVTKSLL